MRLSFAGSDELAAQIRQGIKPDVFASANTKLPDQLFEEGLVERPVTFATNGLVLAVPAGATKVASLDDLSGSDVTLAIGAEGVPVGDYTRKVLGGLPAAQSKAVLANVRSNEPDVGGIVGKLTQGAVDAGFVYRSDVLGAGGKLTAIELPDDLEPTVEYGVAIVKGASNRAGGQAFVDGLLQGPGAQALKDNGFGAPAFHMSQSRWFPPLLAVALAVALTFLVLPIVAIFVDTGPGDLLASLDDPAAIDALTLSLWTSALAVLMIVVVGTPAAYLLATRSFRGRSVLITLIELPLVLPPAVAGIGLLAALGPNGLFGQTLDDAGIRVVLTTAAVVLALTFVAAPFYVRQAEAAFSALDRSWLDASRTLGAGEATTFVRIAIPAALPGLIAGLALAWGRALGEFGATLMFAGSFRGVTQTVPLAIYERFSTDFTAALGLSAVLVAVSGAILLTVKLATHVSPARVLAR